MTKNSHHTEIPKTGGKKNKHNQEIQEKNKYTYLVYKLRVRIPTTTKWLHLTHLQIIRFLCVVWRTHEARKVGKDPEE